MTESEYNEAIVEASELMNYAELTNKQETRLETLVEQIQAYETIKYPIQ